jgi:Protein of unknown function (DUF1236)
MTRRTTLAGAAIALALGISSPCFAQGAGSDFNITTEQRTRMKDYIVRERVAPVTLHERLAVGGRLPADVELRTVPTDWGPSVSRYRYIYSDNHVYFVDPASRAVVHVIE